MFNHLIKLIVILSVFSILNTKSLYAFPTGGGGDCYFCSAYSFGGSVITFSIKSNDNNNLAPVTFNFLEDPATPGQGRLCLSGKIQASIVQNGQTGDAVYELLGSDESNRGVCYSNVTQTCESITGADVGACGAEKCTYTIPKLGQIEDVNTLLDGRFKVDTSDPTTSTGPYEICNTAPETNICNFEVDFNFNAGVPANFFPATKSLNGDDIEANVVLHSTEVCVECQPSNLGLVPGTAALKSKSNNLRACEALTLKADWCSDLQSATGPNCETRNSEGQLTIGGMNTAIGDFQSQADNETVCASNMDNLHNLTACPKSLAVAGCSSGPGYITFPESFQQTTCAVDGSDAEIFYFSAAEGSGTNTVNLEAIGANPDAPGYVGDNTIPQILSTWTAVISTPDNHVNIWNFSGTDMHRVAFIHSRNNDDDITGSTGDDTILGGSGADTLNGHDGNDVIQGGDNSDLLNGDAGNDLLLGYDCSGPNASCAVFSNNGNDNDVLNGGAGNDCLDGGRGNDTISGGAGNDAFVMFGDTDSDTITDFNVAEDVVVDLTGGAAVINWVIGKRGAPSVCTITTGGNNVINMSNITTRSECDAITVTSTSPAQCESHPSNF